MNRFTITFTERGNRYEKEKYRYLVISKAQVKGISLASRREELREGNNSIPFAQLGLHGYGAGQRDQEFMSIQGLRPN